MRAAEDQSAFIPKEIASKLGPAKLLNALRRAYVRMDWDNPEKVECSPILHRIPFLFGMLPWQKKNPES